MTRPWIAALVLLIVVITTNTVQANQKTLDSLIAIALERNPDVKASGFKARASGYEANAAGTLPDPNFSVSFLSLPRSSLALDETPMSGIAVGLSQTIPWPGKLGAKSRVAKLGQQRDEVSAKTVRNRLIYEVTSTYFEYSYWDLAESIIRENLELVNATVSVAEERYAAGKTTAHDVLVAQTASSRLDIRLLNVGQKQQSSLLELRRAVGDASAIADLPPYLPDPKPVTVDSQTFLSNPALLNSELAVDQAEAQRKLSRTGYWPDITLGADYRFRKATPGDPLAGEDFVSFKVGLSIPLWFGGKQKNSVRASEQMLLASRQQQRSVHDWLQKEVEDNRLDAAILRESLDKYDRDIVPRTKAGYEAAEIAYEVAQIDFNALLSAQMQLLDVQLERLDLVRRVNQTEARLRELYGNEFER